MAALVSANAFHPNSTLPPPDTRSVASPNARGTLQILWNCLSLIILSTLNVQHLNIPGIRTPATTLPARWLAAALP